MMASTSMDNMLQTIDLECQFTKGFTGRAALQPRVIEAMRQVPRKEFVPDHLKQMAYENTPLPIGNGQTISQPFIVGLMTDLLEPGQDDVILEIGCGCGYQAAILSMLARQVYSIELIETLAKSAQKRLERLGYNNVEVLQGNGYYGLPDHTPYNGIIVTAAAEHIPPSLKEQLAPVGRLVIPVGYQHMPQSLLLLKKDKNNNFTTQNILPVAFVPLRGNSQLNHHG